MCSKTVVISADGNAGKLSCNPSMGGVSKSQLICELCCLGGTIGSISDRAALGAQLLNVRNHKLTSSLRLQLDKRLYKLLSTHSLTTHKIKIVKALVTQIKRISKGFEIKLEQLDAITTKTIVLATGTSARSVCRIGECSLALDRLSDKSNECVYSLFKAHGASLKRFKTGTSPRLEKASVCWSAASQNKDVATRHGFCGTLNRVTLSTRCKWTHTNEAVYTLIKASANQAPMCLGRLLAKGPRYCLSIEGKTLKFGRKPQKLIMEPEATGSSSVYVNGLSTSMPIELQLQLLKFTKAFRGAKIIKAGYAIEYDCVCSSGLKSTLESANASNIYTAGQINGTTGYEEASAQGFVAGLNAAARVLAKREYTFGKQFSYIGILIDNITNNALSEPYRVLTTRARNRTQLRQRNAILRLFPHSLSINLLARRKQFKLVCWAHASKRFKSKLASSHLRSAIAGNASVILSKLGSSQNSIWQSLIKQQRES
ncbi:MAG: tRNA uridine 5-carboxymethylaminomethyl modification enzyme GidA [Candidatus Hodgkinia cicadicola]|nr:MAG: tRNA uridine 5-carboxymethylaminomethyl modification enzyme GidA [Candidatus Hodgkinia cicadicola]